MVCLTQMKINVLFHVLSLCKKKKQQTEHGEKKELDSVMYVEAIFCITDLFQVLKIVVCTPTSLFHGLVCNPANSSVCVFMCVCGCVCVTPTQIQLSL